MTTWVVLGVAVSVVGGAYGWVTWRDRRRGPAEDPAAGRAARVEQNRYEAGRHAAQGEVVRRDQQHG